MRLTPTPRPAVAIVIAVTLAAGACGGDAEPSATEAPPITTEDGRTITTLPTGGDDGMALDPAAGASSDGDGANAGGSGQDPDGTAGRDRFGAPRSGRYAYETPGSEGEEDGQFFYWFGDLEHRGDSLLQARQIAGDTFDNRAELIWTAGGDLFLAREQRSSEGEISPVCDWTPDLLLYPGDLRQGREWQAEASCSGGGGGGTRTRTVTGRVVEREMIEIDGVSVDVIVVERVETTISQVGEIRVVERLQTTERFSPGLGLLVAMEGSRTAEFPGAPEGAGAIRERLVSTVPT